MATKKKLDTSEAEQDPESTKAAAIKSPPTARGRKAQDGASEKPAAKKAKSAAKKVAAAVSETVKEIAEKVTKKATSAAAAKRAKTTAASSKPASDTAEKKTAVRRSSKTATSDDPPAKPARRVSARTKTAALAEGVTTEDVHETIMDLSSSEDVPAESREEGESATDVKEHYFEDQHLHKGPPPPQAPRDLPDEYGDTKIVLLVRDPEWVYAYWEVNDDARAQLDFPRNGNGRTARRLVLRIYKITDTAWPIDAAHYFFDVELPTEARNWYVHLPEADQQWCAELGLIDSADNFTSICRSNIVMTPRNSISDRIDSDWMTVQESFEKITRLSRASLDAQLHGGSSTSSEAILRTINRQLTAVLHGEKAALSSGIFSSESAIPMRSKDFWLQVHTELILYGATEPDARVTVQGQPVQLNDDGTFSMRFALPDGLQILEVRAVNADGDLDESVTPVVERTTR